MSVTLSATEYKLSVMADMAMRRGSVWHRFGYLHGFGQQVPTGTGTGIISPTLAKPVGLMGWQVGVSLHSQVPCGGKVQCQWRVCAAHVKVLWSTHVCTLEGAGMAVTGTGSVDSSVASRHLQSSTKSHLARWLGKCI